MLKGLHKNCMIIIGELINASRKAIKAAIKGRDVPAIQKRWPRTRTKGGYDNSRNPLILFGRYEGLK